MKVFSRTPVNIESIRVVGGQVFLIAERCKGCEICVQFCPNQVLQTATGLNSRGYHYPEIRSGKEGSCTHCEFCTMICPEFAIFSTEAKG